MWKSSTNILLNFFADEPFSQSNLPIEQSLLARRFDQRTKCRRSKYQLEAELPDEVLNTECRKKKCHRKNHRYTPCTCLKVV